MQCQGLSCAILFDNDTGVDFNIAPTTKKLLMSWKKQKVRKLDINVSIYFCHFVYPSMIELFLVLFICINS